MFSNVKVGTKLYASFAAVIAILVVLVAVSYSSLASLEEANRWNLHTYEVIGEADGMLGSLIDTETGERGFALSGKDDFLEPYRNGSSGFQKHLEKAKQLTSDNPKQQERLQSIGDGQRAWVTTVLDPEIGLRRGVNEGRTAMDAVVASVQAGKGKQFMDKLRNDLADLSGAERVLLEKRSKDVLAIQARTNMVLVVGGLTAVLLAAALAFSLTRSVTHRLTQAVDAVGRVAEGDLTVRVESNSTDELGVLLGAVRNVVEKLSASLGTVRAAASQVASASKELSSTSEAISNDAQEQAASLEETAASLEQITATVRQNTDSAQQALQLANSAGDVAERGGQVVASVVVAMGEINESSRRIADIITTIDEISFQTNLLALNAAVEAARAGEYGRGFAVVATEVRTLAQRSGGAAKEIRGLIGDAGAKVAAGSKLVSESGEMLDAIVVSVKRVTDMVSEIAAASREQYTGIETVNQAVTQMDQVTQSNAAQTEELTATAQGLSGQAEELMAQVGRFRFDDDFAPDAVVRPIRLQAQHPESATRLVARAKPLGRAVGS